jgi:hypothetical protein
MIKECQKAGRDAREKTKKNQKSFRSGFEPRMNTDGHGWGGGGKRIRDRGYGIRGKGKVSGFLFLVSGLEPET